MNEDSEACETPMADHIECAMQWLEKGPRMLLDSIPDDSSMASASFPGDITIELAKMLRKSQDKPSHTTEAR